MRALLRRTLVRVLAPAAAFAAVPIMAAPPADAVSGGLVIAEVYGAGGNSGAAFNADFVELRNLGTAAATLNGLSLQYRSQAGTAPAGTVALTGTVAPGARYLVQMSATGASGAPLPTPDQVASPAIAMSGTDGQVLLATSTTAFTGTGNVAGDPALVDMVGYGDGAATFETNRTGVDLTAATSAQRGEGAPDTDDNAADFSEQPPTPDSGLDTVTDRTIAEIQGTGPTSPEAGNNVRTGGVVTARYPRGGFAGFYIQTGGQPDTPGASDGLFVYSPGLAADDYPAIGTSVEVTGEVQEFHGTTELVLSGSPGPLSPAQPAVTPYAAAWDTIDDEGEREAHEGELVSPQGPFTVTDSYATDQYGEIGLAAGDQPLRAPTDVFDAQGTDDDALAADNARHLITLDDGSSVNFRNADNLDQPFSWLTPDNPVRAGAPVTWTGPVVLEYRNNQWNFQPTLRITGAGRSTATFADTRTPAPENVGGDVRLATFNVLNFFPTTGEEYAAQGGGHSCTYFYDRDGEKTTVDTCSPNGPRGAATETSLARQRSKIVTAINRLGAGIVSLEEIENSVQFGKDRDFALGQLVAALNADAGAGTWAFVPSPPASELPPTAEQDVIRTAFIYQPALMTPVGPSQVLTGSAAFADAREPLAQAFKRTGTPDASAFAVIVNHFKSKGSGTPDPYGQGNANDQRVAQAQALDAFATSFGASRGTESIFLTGDFNAYTEEDPVQVLSGDGWTNLESTTQPGETSYYFDGLAGSLDHVFANAAALQMVTGVDIWGINAEEPVAYEYSRYNGNATLLYDGSTPFRASDHNPEVIGLDLPSVGTLPSKITAKASPDKPHIGDRVRLDITVKAKGHVPTGSVLVHVADQPDQSVTLAQGRAVVWLEPFTTQGQKQVVLTYSGDEEAMGSTLTLVLTVRH